MSWVTLAIAFLIEGVAVVGWARGTAPWSAAAVAHGAAALLAAISIANRIPGARGRSIAVVAAVPALLAPPAGLVVPALLLLLSSPEPVEMESTWDEPPVEPPAGPALEARPPAPAAVLEAEPLLDDLRFGDVARRRAAARRLAGMDSAVSVPALRSARDDPDPEIARHARDGLARAEARVNREIVGARDVLRRDPLSPLANAALGDHYAEYADLGVLDSSTRRHYLELAVKVYARALELSHEQIPDLFLSIGAALTGLGRHKVALTFLDRALAARPRDARTLVRRTEPLVRLGRVDEAVEGCRRALALGVRDRDLAAIAAYWASEGSAAAGAGAPPVATSAGEGAPAPERAFVDLDMSPDRLDAEIGEVMAGLNGPLSLERAEAERRLYAYATDAAVDAAWRLLPDATETAKVAVARWLAQVGGARAVRRIGVLLSAPEDVVRREAALMLERVEGPGRVETLVRALESGTVFARTYAARAAAASGERRAVRALIDNLDDPRLEVREAAISALARLRDKRAVPALARQLEDGRPELRLAAVLALADLGDARARGTLAAACADPNGAVRQAACFALARTAGRGALPALVRALEEDVDATVRQEAARRLGELAATEAARTGLLARAIAPRRIERALDPLLRAAALDRSQVVRAAARVAIDVVPPEAAFPATARALADPDPRVRHVAATKLGRLAPGISTGRRAARLAAETARRALEPLVAVLSGDPNAAVRAGAADTLGRLGATLAAASGARATAALEGALGDEEESVAGAAAAALGRLLSGEDLLSLARRMGALEAARLEVVSARAASTSGDSDASLQSARTDEVPRARKSPVLERHAFLRLVQQVAHREPLPEDVFRSTLAALADPSANVRYLAALALERTRRPEALEPLLALAARDEIASIRATAARGAAHVTGGDPGPLLDRLARPPRDEERAGAPPIERDRALLLALAAGAGRRAADATSVERLLLLAPGLRERGTLPACEPQYLACFRAAPAELARLVGSAAGRRSADEPEPFPARVRTAALAARVLGRLGREGVSIPDRSELREAVGAPAPSLRVAAALALGELRDQDSVAALVALAGKDREADVRAAARAAVARILAPPGAEPEPSEPTATEAEAVA